MSKKKHTLKNDVKVEYLALGIISTESEFQLSLLLNTLLSINLSLTSPILKETGSEELSFPRLKYDNEENLLVVVIKNKLKGVCYFQNLSSFDYILLLAGIEAFKYTDLIQKEFKSQANVSIISALDIKKLGKLNTLLT